MTPNVATLKYDLAPTREFLRDAPVLPVLIRVPALRTTAMRRARRRRRLRREVRIGGMAVLFGAPLIALGLVLPGIAPPAAIATRTATASAPAPVRVDLPAPPVVSLLPVLEPVVPPSVAEPPAAVETFPLGTVADDHWVAAWAAGPEESPSPPAVAESPSPPAVAASRSESPAAVVPLVRTSGYLLPGLPADQDRFGGEESAHAGY